jgi:hypothetical protein
VLCVLCVFYLALALHVELLLHLRLLSNLC